MRAIPQWFRRELRFIDPRMEIEYDPHYNFFNIYITVGIEAYSKAEGRRVRRNERILKGCFRDLNETAMRELHERHWIAQRYMAKGDRNAYTKMIASNNNEYREKQKQLAVDMMTEGSKKIGQAATMKMYDMGGTA